MIALYDLFQATLVILVILFALLSIYIKNLSRALFAFVIMSVLLGLLFFTLNAPMIAIVQLMVYAGLVPILLLIVLSLTKGVEESDEEVIRE